MQLSWFDLTMLCSHVFNVCFSQMSRLYSVQMMKQVKSTRQFIANFNNTSQKCRGHLLNSKPLNKHMCFSLKFYMFYWSHQKVCGTTHTWFISFVNVAVFTMTFHLYSVLCLEYRLFAMTKHQKSIVCIRRPTKLLLICIQSCFLELMNVNKWFPQTLTDLICFTVYSAVVGLLGHRA